MPQFDKVPQGWGGFYTLPSPNQNNWVGTDGLFTCVGVYVAYVPAGGALRNFVAHIDCDVQVQGHPGDADFDYVSQAAQGLLTTHLGAYDAAVDTVVETFSAGNDRTKEALLAGVAFWRGAVPPFGNYDGFMVRYDGTDLGQANFNDPANAIQGQFVMSVPAQPVAAAGGGGVGADPPPDEPDPDDPVPNATVL
jgi:hypothetical protein